MPVERRIIENQPSWVLSNKNVELAVTERGAHMAPVIFCRDQKKPVLPYYISPWQREGHGEIGGVLNPLRGDFFCLPFGINGEFYKNECHPLHGEAAGEKWSLRSCQNGEERSTLTLELQTKIRPGFLQREFRLVDGHNVVYCRTVIDGFWGKSPFAHHAILKMPESPKSLLVSSSPFAFGMTYPIEWADPSNGSRQYLASGKRFETLQEVPVLSRKSEMIDCTLLPLKRGFCDLLQTFERPRNERVPGPSWVAAVNLEENWMWFALKDHNQMPGRMFWIEDCGIDTFPSQGRNRCLGIEDGRMYFDRGIRKSCRSNPVSRSGIPTCITLKPNKSYEVRYIQGAAKIQREMGKVSAVSFSSKIAIFEFSSGRRMEVPVDHDFLYH